MKKFSLKTQLNICVSFVWIGAVLALLSKVVGPWCLWLGLAILVVAAACRYSLIRCPHCGHRLIEGNRIPAQCPKCKEALQ